MSNAIDISQSAFRNVDVGAQAAQQAAAKATGQFGGYQLAEASSPMSLLADAAEELTFAHDNTKELDLKERSDKKSAKSDFITRVMLYKELMHEAGRDHDVSKLANNIKNMETAKQMLEEAGKFFGDGADGYAALMEIKEGLEKEGDLRTLALVDEALATMEAEKGPEIRAELAGALAAEGYNSLGKPLSLKDSYRKLVFDFASPGDMFGFILEKFGKGGFDEAISFLLKALGQDLASDKASTETSHLQNVAGQLGQVRILNGVHSGGEKLSGNWKKLCNEPEHKFSAMDYLKFILDLKGETFISAYMIEPMVTLAAPGDIEKEVLFLQDFFNVTKNISIQAFDNLESRDRCLKAIQELLDTAIDKEDEYLASLD